MPETIDTHAELSILEAAAALPNSKDGRGIGEFVDAKMLESWVNDYLAGQSDETGRAIAFRFGVQAEGRFAGQSFVEAESELRSEWSSERVRLPWDGVRDAVWTGFDRARDRRM
jgi:hypothetical protein